MLSWSRRSTLLLCLFLSGLHCSGEDDVASRTLFKSGATRALGVLVDVLRERTLMTAAAHGDALESERGLVESYARIHVPVERLTFGDSLEQRLHRGQHHLVHVVGVAINNGGDGCLLLGEVERLCLVAGNAPVMADGRARTIRDRCV